MQSVISMFFNVTSHSFNYYWNYRLILNLSTNYRYSLKTSATERTICYDEEQLLHKSALFQIFIWELSTAELFLDRRLLWMWNDTIQDL